VPKSGILTLPPKCSERTTDEVIELAGYMGKFLVSCLLIAPLRVAQTDTTLDELSKPFDWPVIVSKGAGLQMSVRTAWADGLMKYVVKLADSKGRIERYVSKHGIHAVSSFQVTFADEAGFRLYTIYIPDSALSRSAGTASYEADGQGGCTEKIYRAAIKASKASGQSDNATIGLTYPSELETPLSAPRR
jgi:hypothetical protein